MLARKYFTLPAIRGIQATREYYVVMVRIRQIESFNWLDPDSIPQPELRAQRTLTKSRIPAIRDYIVHNPTEYVLPALTMTVDSYVFFEPASTKPGFNNVGLLKILPKRDSLSTMDSIDWQGSGSIKSVS